MPRNPHPADDLAMSTLAVVVFVLAVLFLLSGCATTTRLNPGECLVIVEGDQIIVAGKQCDVKRFNR